MSNKLSPIGAGQVFQMIDKAKLLSRHQKQQVQNRLCSGRIWTRHGSINKHNSCLQLFTIPSLNLKSILQLFTTPSLNIKPILQLFTTPSLNLKAVLQLFTISSLSLKPYL